MVDYAKQLGKYMPEAAAPIISKWINDTGCRFKISRSRSTKLGDYRAPHRGSAHQITVNHDLNPFAFLITSVHEFAHLKTWDERKASVKPHGKEWKNNFKLLMEPFLKLDVFPSDIVHAISLYLRNPAASSCTDIHLFRTLKKYDTPAVPVLHVEDLDPNSIFKLKNGRTFQKLDKARTRYKCKELPNERVYLFHPLAEVFLVKD